jgi:hypothetical protein
MNHNNWLQLRKHPMYQQNLLYLMNLLYLKNRLIPHYHLMGRCFDNKLYHYRQLPKIL